MTLAALELLVAVCAPSVAPSTLLAIIEAESGGVPHAVHVNGPWHATPRDREEAIRVANWAMRSGYTVDLGLMQVNSRHLRALGLSVEEVLEPCTNVRTGAAILTRHYVASAASRHRYAALLDALSAYNTGNARAGFANGYVERVLRFHHTLVHEKLKHRRRE